MNIAPQIRSLPTQTYVGNVTKEAPVRVSAGGVVIDNDKSDDSFYVTSWQDMVGIPLLTPLKIRATFRLKDGFLRSHQPLPDPHTVINFTGDLISVTNEHAKVAVDDHSFFDMRGDEFDAVDEVHDDLPWL